MVNVLTIAETLADATKLKTEESVLRHFDYKRKSYLRFLHAWLGQECRELIGTREDCHSSAKGKPLKREEIRMDSQMLSHIVEERSDDLVFAIIASRVPAADE